MGIAGALQLSAIGMLLGLQPLPTSAPIVDLVRHHALITLAIGGFSLLTVAMGLVIVYQPTLLRHVVPITRERARSTTFPYLPLLISTTALATVSTASLIGTVTLVLARPGWCPDVLCPGTANEPQGTYHSNLVVAFSALQGSTFLIPGDPAQYTLRNLPVVRGPQAIIAQQTISTADTASRSPYRLQISVRSRRPSNPIILIENVSLVIQSATSQPSPANIWIQPGQDEDLQINPYDVIYEGQVPGAAIPARYAGGTRGHVRLSPQELDYLTLTLKATTSGYVRFQIRVDYRLTNERQLRSLTLNRVFTTVFADPHTWQPYQLTNDRLSPIT